MAGNFPNIQNPGLKICHFEEFRIRVERLSTYNHFSLKFAAVCR